MLETPEQFATAPPGVDPPLWLQNAGYPAIVDRDLLDAVWTAAGVIGAGDLAVGPRGAGANMSVDVAAGRVIVVGSDAAGQGKYLCRSSATVNLPVGVAPGPGTSRIDLVVAHVYDDAVIGGTDHLWLPEVVAGTAAASPVAPPVPNSALVLAAARPIPNALAAVVAGNIADRRVTSLLGSAAGALRVIAEVVRTSNSAQFGTAITAVPGHAATFTPVAGRSYYMHHAANFLVSTSGFPRLMAMVPNAAGTQYGYLQVVQSNLAPLWFDLSCPLLLPTGSPITVALCAQASTGTFQIQGSANGPGLWQILERDGVAVSTV